MTADSVERDVSGASPHADAAQSTFHDTPPSLAMGAAVPTNCRKDCRPLSDEPNVPIAGCPAAERLWPVAVGEDVPGPIAAHMATCARCQHRAAQLAREIDEARRFLSNRTADHRAGATPQAAGTGGGPHRVGGKGPSAAGADPPIAAGPLAMIGKYFVLESICESGQATVYRGLHPSLLVDVVIKLAHQPWRGDDPNRARLVWEARALAEIVHPHLARLYDLDFFDDRPFLVLEYVRGRHLAHYRQSTAIDPGRIVQLVAKIARAVAAAHEQGILHLDLKPENILVTPHGEPVLIDFGLSFLSSSARSRTFDGGCVAGTPQYMAPEQLQGQRAGLTPRTDVYGLGGLLYFLCVGRDPFLVRDIGGRLSRPSEPDWQALFDADVPGRLKSICRKAMSSNPHHRYANAEALADSLEEAGRRWTRVALRRMRQFAAGAFLAGAGCLAAAAYLPGESLGDGARLHVHLVRADRLLSIADALPIRPADGVRLVGEVGLSSDLAFFSVDGSHRLQWLAPLARRVDSGGLQVAYPSFADQFPVSADPRTQAVILVSRRAGSIRRHDARDIGSLTKLLASLPPRTAIRFDRDRCEVIAASNVPLTSSLRRALERQVCALRHELAGRFDDFAGLLIAPPD